MSLDFDLYRTGKYDDNDETFNQCVFSWNVTHNLGEMARACGVYNAMWRPEESGFKNAEDVIEELEKGLQELKSKPTYYKKFNPSNGWGSYDGFCESICKIIEACKENPKAKIETCK